MMEVHCKEHLAAARAFADEQGPEIRAQLEEKLAFLEHYRQDTCICQLQKDALAPHSFFFVLYGPPREDGKRTIWFHGGLILHPPHSTGSGAPEYATIFEPKSVYHWEVHT